MWALAWCGRGARARRAGGHGSSETLRLPSRLRLQVGAPACGDVMKLQIKVDDSGKITGAHTCSRSTCAACGG